ncbi:MULTISPECIES: protein-L-isoaspartate(D-aspartate) O-methyltransferase [unclassified Oleiphilus]|jgi:protein-L-isoaspartate(D-aspartate) O-methyltransferase|nr:MULTISPECIES: protein-L-isoaspartate(D-aspartate) O-methyltransferase [unclassified Oleiphilus]KZY76733.1 protein-L-isoaspartate O-methyltransferase [Oleiphilus sp. HI0068]KZY78142.1 protein-L-isoaspartate O-methyltransferase [Oleiphilus sp. HI0069]KZY85741.1 protein-L-isoaspartate O-methyltransferase [Oleiphilus sp. HI0072]KZZ19193.1 protein-L-isoaspartate O-methyltransferase [Oleiphilus sp. HI0081]KZZ19800.1 protein-L-isoaspartate O-methyltransferase [Oleiphilus sp. HI0078]KZZ33498.1 pro
MTSRRTRMRLIQRLRDEGITNEDVLAVMLDTPRHIFLDEALSHRAYEDTALPIGHNQTISQPYIVARMTELLLQTAPRRVLELGTGSGYQAAVLAQLVGEVYSVERINPLLEKAVQRFKLLGLNNISTRHADGGIGWPERGLYDAVIMTAAPTEIPLELVRQLKEGGRMILPLGDAQQSLTIVTRKGSSYEQKIIEPAMFVPFLPGTIR